MRKVFFVLAAILLAASGQAQKGVTINGVTWARSNVGSPGTFVDEPEQEGGRYTFKEAQTACPEGWRLPTREEFKSLEEAGSDWVTQQGVTGRRAGRGDASIFLPGPGGLGRYWSSTPRGAMAYTLTIARGQMGGENYNGQGSDFAVRCVRPLVLSERNANLEKLSGQEGINYVYVSKAMLGLIAGAGKGSGAKINGLDMATLAGKLNALQLVSAEKPEAVRRLRAEAARFPKEKMEVLMRVVQEEQRTEFFTLEEGGVITSLLMFNDSGDGYTILLIQGRFTSEDIQAISETVSK